MVTGFPLLLPIELRCSTSASKGFRHQKSRIQTSNQLGIIYLHHKQEKNLSFLKVRKLARNQCMIKELCWSPYSNFSQKFESQNRTKPCIMFMRVMVQSHPNRERRLSFYYHKWICIRKNFVLKFFLKNLFKDDKEKSRVCNESYPSYSFSNQSYQQSPFIILLSLRILSTISLKIFTFIF